MGLTLSYACIDDASERIAVRLAKVLAAAGSVVAPWRGPGHDPRPDAGLVLAAGVGVGELGRIADLTRVCPGRVLVVWHACGAEPTLSQCHELMAAGAEDVVAWTPDGATTGVVSRIVSRWAEIDEILRSDLVAGNLIGRSPAWRRLLRRVIEATRFSQVPLLVTGETGTGKELIARLIHSIDPKRRDADLIVVDCTTLSPELAGSELFGHERGAFTGASESRQGAFARAHGGTLFLDEIGDLSLGLQGPLLRAVQERLYKRVGGNAWTTTDFRLVCATNRDLAEEVARGRFRSDLYHRIAGITCRTPALRERVEDIPDLTRHFLREALGVEAEPPLSRALSEYLIARDYPGNVRDLRMLVQSLARRYVGTGALSVGTLPEDRRDLGGAAVSGSWRDDVFEQAIRRAVVLGASLRQIGRAAEDVAVRTVLAESGSTIDAARRLGVSPRAVQARRSSLRGRADGDKTA